MDAKNDIVICIRFPFFCMDMVSHNSFFNKTLNIKFMRLFLVRTFVGYTKIKSTLQAQIAKMFLIPVLIAVFVMTGTKYPELLLPLLGISILFLIINTGQKTFSMLRAARVLYPVYYVLFLTFARTHRDLDAPFLWYHYAILFFVALFAWLGFSLWGIGYWGLFPAKKSELDLEQLTDYNNDKLKLNLKAR